MTNPIKDIYQFNFKAGLLDQGYDDERECAFPIEEMLEGFNTTELSTTLGIPKASPKTISRQIIDFTNNDGISDVDRLDKHLDSIVFNFGSIFKLGLTPQQATQALNVVIKHNMAKLTMPKDEYGKLTKPEDFVGPEAELQSILDQRDAKKP